ncbi:MAG: hypothetical protein H6751_12960 [Candidatus Omnitrophica bacterium]|nr:hypothetical protein [Candidatus Omnitrophota bacterium]
MVERGIDPEEAEFQVFRHYVPNVHSMIRYVWNPQVRLYLLGVIGQCLCFILFILGSIWVIGHEEEGFQTDLILLSFSIGVGLIAVFLIDVLGNVWVEGGDRIVCRNLFKKEVIHIADIQGIISRRSYLLFFETYLLETSTDRLILNPSTKGCESVLAILQSLKPKVVVRGTRPLSKKRTVLLIAAFLPLICYLIAFPGVWGVEGLSLFLPIALILGLQVFIAEIFFHKDRAKIALLYLRLALLTPVPPFLAFLGFGRVDLFQWTALLWLLFFILQVLTIIWWGRSSFLFGISIVLITLGLLSLFFIPAVWNGEKEIWTTTSDFNDQLVWVGNDRIAMIENGYNRPSKLNLLTKNGIEKEVNLGSGRCEFLEPYSEEVLTLKKSAWRVAGASEEILLCNLEGGLQILPFNPERVTFFYSDLVQAPLWSPDRKSLILTDIAEDASGEREYSLAIGTASTGDIRKATEPTRFSAGAWISDTEIKLTELKNYQQELPAASRESFIRVHRLNPKTGMTELVADYSMDRTEQCWAFPGGEYAFLIRPSKYSENKTQLMRLSDGERTDLPPISRRIEGSTSWLMPFSWSEQSKRFAYFSETRGKPCLSVIGIDGFESTLNLKEGAVFGNIKISPDGNQVIYDLCSVNKTYLEPIVQVFHWKVGEDDPKRFKIAKIGIGITFNPCPPWKPPRDLGLVPSLARWSPDSQKLALWGMMEAEGLSSRLWVYHLGGG